MIGVGSYRVRQARVEVCNGYHCWIERRWIAERRALLLWLFPIWWPVGDCRASEGAARRDAVEDAVLRLPLDPPSSVEVK